jgi:hybrid cluster-associated redox disulfide protein
MAEARITKDMTFNEVFTICPDASDVLEQVGLRCHECAIARMSTVEDCAVMHELDLDSLLEQLNSRIRPTKPDESAP